MKIEPIDNTALKYIAADEAKLGFPTGFGTRRFSGADTVAIRNSSGFIIEADGKTSAWPIQKIMEYDGNMIAIGPWVEGTQPFESRPLSLSVLSSMLPVARGIKSAEFSLKGLYRPGMRWLPDGGVLVFPPKLAEWVRELSPDDKWIHPDRSGESALSFSLGVLAWAVLTGGDPFADETGEARRERIRGGVLPPLETLVPGIDEALEDVIRRSLIEKDESHVPNLEDWELLLQTWNRKGIKADLSDSELEQRRMKAERRSRGMEKGLNARRWFRKSGWKLFTVIAVTASVLAFASAPIRKAMKVPASAGMAPMQVAELYYGAIDAMDSEIMGDCLAKKVGRDDTRLVDTVYVTTRVRQGYEGTGDMPKASEWIADGRPELPPGIWPWGISNLELKDLGGNRIEARYRLWTPPEGGIDANITGWATSRIDILSFTEARRSWEISNIERVTVD